MDAPDTGSILDLYSISTPKHSIYRVFIEYIYTNLREYISSINRGVTSSIYYQLRFTMCQHHPRGTRQKNPYTPVRSGDVEKSYTSPRSRLPLRYRSPFLRLRKRTSPGACINFAALETHTPVLLFRSIQWRDSSRLRAPSSQKRNLRDQRVVHKRASHVLQMLRIAAHSI